MSLSLFNLTQLLNEYLCMYVRRPGSSTVYMRIAYLDDNMRIVRNEADNKIFVYNRLI
jgi:hypothetical protein